MKKLLIATTNQGKAAEYKSFLGILPIELLTLKDAAINAIVDEDGKTFEENAIKKAKFYSELSGLPALGDDGGIEIDYLGGEPGVLSRRWPGHEASDDELILMTLTKLAGVPWEKRTASLRVVIALKFPYDDKAYTAEGAKCGFIRKTPLDATSGYPFRALFYIPELGKTYSELTPEEELKFAHRKYAIDKLIPIIKEKLLN